MKYIELRVYIMDECQDDIEEIAETIKDGIYDGNEASQDSMIKDITYEIKKLEN